jgi:isohexenylglutaconyl-CoA hydratase
MSSDTLIVARDGPLLKIAMHRPRARNALSQTMVRELTDAISYARDDADIRVLVLTGSGGNFCAGGDLKGMQLSQAGGGPAQTAAANRRFGALLELIDALPKAVIALIEGAAMGGGVGLIAVSDWAIADAGASIATPEVTVGIPPAQIAPFLVARIGYAQARRMATYGIRMSAQEALRIGLVHELADTPAELSDKATAAANQCLRCAPSAIAETKRLIRASRREPTGPTLDQASHVFAAALAGEAQEGIRAFMEKRKPVWAKTVLRV